MSSNHVQLGAERTYDLKARVQRFHVPLLGGSSAAVCSSAVRVDNPLPGDQVIRRRQDDSVVRRGEVFVITHWPDADTIVAGPYQSYGYALRQAHGMLKDRSERIWYDHALIGRPEELEQVGGHGHA